MDGRGTAISGERRVPSQGPLAFVGPPCPGRSRMSSTGTLSAGTVVAGRYRIEEPLGGEGSAAAYRATDLRLERAVALRALGPAEGVAGQQGKAAARLVHPNVARVLDFGPDAELGVEFVVADLGTGGTLAALLAQRGAPPLPLALRIIQEAAAGMAAAHRAGLVHGDLHPGALWLSRDEGRLRVQVLGLGLNPAGAPPARATARYAAPERLRRGRDLAPAADVFSLGVVAYEVFAALPAEWMQLLLSMARGQAVMAPSLLDARPDLPAHVAQAVRRALVADPAQRWPDAGDFAAHLIAESAAPARPAPVAAPAPEPVEAPITAASFAAHVAEAAAPADEDTDEVAADAIAASEAEPVAAAAAVPVEPVPAVVASVNAPAPAESAIVEAAAEPVIAEAAPAPPAKRQTPVRPRQPIAASRTDLADSLYIPPTLEKAARPEPRTPVRAEAPAPAPAPPAEVIAPAPEPVRVKAEPVVAAPEPVVLQRESGETIAAPMPVEAPRLESVALVPSTPAGVSLATVEVDGPGATLIPIPERRMRGMAAMGGKPSGNRRVLLAASIAGAVLVSGGLIAKTVLAGSGARPAPQQLAAAGLTTTPGGTAQPKQVAVDPAAQQAAIDTQAAVDPTLTPEEQARKAEELKKLEEQRRLQQRQRDSLRQAQQLAAQQQLPAAPQVVLAAARPAAAAGAPQLEQRAAAPAASEPAAAPPPAAAARASADPNRVYGGGEVDQAPSLSNGSAFRSAVNRSYPSTLRNTGRWGNALVSFTVGADGRVERSSISVEQASHPAFRSAAASALAAARFTPARVNGQPVRAHVSMPITWQGGGERDEED
jgi:TonB family protein